MSALVAVAWLTLFSTAESERVWAQSSLQDFPSQVSAIIRQRIDRQAGAVAGYNLDFPALRRLYDQHSDAPFWVGSTAARDNGDAAINVLDHADQDGLYPRSYFLDAIAVRRRSGSVEAAADFDMLVTAGLLNYLHDLHAGSISTDAVGFTVGLPSYAYDSVTALSNAIQTGQLAGLPESAAPQHSEYAQLKSALAGLRELAAQGGWPSMPGVAPIDIDGGDSRIALLRARLAVEDSQLTDDQSASALSDAVKRFQSRNGIAADGIVGRATFAALNISTSARIHQVIANMERWRWLPNRFEPVHIEVNAADATLKVLDNGKIVLQSRVIVGKSATPTPIFSAEITGVTVNPNWNIPQSIARNEILPRERRHPGYMASARIVNGAGGTYRQLPGDDNSLGRIKIEMPNPFNSYLHDTPVRNLFEKSERHLSHGCMRVQAIAPLASFLLTRDKAADISLAAALETHDTKTFLLDRPLPIYVLYWTVIARDDGIEFRPDIYDRDTKLLAALAGARLKGKVSSNTDCGDRAAG